MKQPQKEENDRKERENFNLFPSLQLAANAHIAIAPSSCELTQKRRRKEKTFPRKMHENNAIERNPKESKFICTSLPSIPSK